jgi:hypothetical protein
MIRYSGGSIDRGAIRTFLKNDLFRRNFPTGNTKSKDLILKYTRNFRDYIARLPITEDQYPDPYCRYSVAFFENNDAYREFIGRNPDRVVFIMGYSTHPDHNYNFLRPVLAGVDTQGRIIGSESVNPSPFNDGKLLQHSWPPPPPTQ